MNHHKSLLTLHFFLHVFSIVGLYYYWNPYYLFLTIFAKWLFYNVGIEIGLHRLVTHRSFVTTTAIENVLIFLSIFGGFGSSLGWAANHRVHHRNSDKEGDPHPANEPLKTWFWIDTEKKVTISPTIVKDLLKNPFHKWTRDHYFKIWIITLLLSASISIPFTLYFFVVPGMLSMFSGGLLNVVCHKWGYRNFNTNDASTNNWLVWIFSCGGGAAWHNNHHANPNSYTTKIKWYEFDLDGIIIKHCLAR